MYQFQVIKYIYDVYDVTWYVIYCMIYTVYYEALQISSFLIFNKKSIFSVLCY